MKRKMKSKDQVIYKANLQRVGSLVDESLIALAEFAKVGNWKEAEKLICRNNLLSKRSSITLKGILNAICKRFLSNREFLPSEDLLAKIICFL